MHIHSEIVRDITKIRQIIPGVQTLTSGHGHLNVFVSLRKRFVVPWVTVVFEYHIFSFAVTTMIFCHCF